MASDSFEPLRGADGAPYPPPPSPSPLSRGHSLLRRINPLQAPLSSLRPNNPYNRLDDGAPDRGHRRGISVRSIEEEEENAKDAIGVDLSAFEGPIELTNVRPVAPTGRPAQVPGFKDAELREVLDSSGNHLGWSRIEVPSPAPPPKSGHPMSAGLTPRNNTFGSDKGVKISSQDIVDANEPAVDLSYLSGGDYSSNVTDLELKPTNDERQERLIAESYDMPNWKPVPMKAIYIIILILLALALAGIQEWVCRLSMAQVAQGQGLITFKDSIQNVSVTNYFLWKYLPIIVVVFYGILWQLTDFEVKRLEPFYQLSRPKGAPAEQSLNLDYLSAISYLTPLQSFRYRHWAVFITSIAALLSGMLVPVLQQGSVKSSQVPAPNQPGATIWIVTIVPGFSRATSAALIAAALLGAVLLFQLRRKSGLQSDPQGIAGIAAMATRSHILNDFRGLDVAPRHVIHKQLRDRRYLLYKSSLWQGEYLSSAQNSMGEMKAENPHPIMLRLIAGIPYCFIIVQLMWIIPWLFFQEDLDIHVTWVFTGLSTLIRVLWSNVDLSVRQLEPFYRLSRRNARSNTLTLNFLGCMPFWATIKAIYYRTTLVALVSAGSILTEVLTVTVTTVTAQRASASAISHFASLIMTEMILTFLLGLMLIVLLRRRKPFLPRQPGTIASTLGFIHQSNMLLDFANTETFDTHRMEMHLRAIGKTYGLGWFRGRDGQDHCGIDEEPLLAKYEHGKDWKNSRLQGDNIGAWERYD